MGCIIVPVLVVLSLGTVFLIGLLMLGSAARKDPVGICLGVSCVVAQWRQYVSELLLVSGIY